MDDLKNIQIGATIAYSYGQEFDEADKSDQLQVQRVTSDLQNFKKLFNDRVQIVDVGYYLLQTEFPEKAPWSLITTKWLIRVITI
ncbi:hypothetical protein [Psychromonas sp. Urea-02u-13]